MDDRQENSELNPSFLLQRPEKDVKQTDQTDSFERYQNRKSEHTVQFMILENQWTRNTLNEHVRKGG